MMHSNDTIQNELKELNSILAGVSNKNVYTVPDGYFEVLSYDILLALEQQAIQLADNNTVPTGYFDGLADAIMDKIKAGVVNDEGSALLAKLKNINVYRVPPGYFNNLAAGIVNKLHQPAKVVVMEKHSSFFRYAAAAVITGIIGLSVISVFDKKQTENSLASTTAVMANATEIIKTNSFDKVLSTVADEDIVNYLQKSGLDVNAALVASVSDDKNLPDQVDYLTDDKTLDNLLSGLKIGESTNN